MEGHHHVGEQEVGRSSDLAQSRRVPTRIRVRESLRRCRSTASFDVARKRRNLTAILEEYLMRYAAVLLVAFACSGALLTAASGQPAEDKKEQAAPLMPVNAETGLFQYREIVAVDGTPADVLYVRAKGFVLDSYLSAKAAVDLDDPALHRLAAIGNFRVSYQGGVVTVEHKLSIEVKDGQYRYTLDHFVTVENRTPLEAAWVRKSKLTTRSAERCQTLIENLKVAMSQPRKEW